MDEYELELLHMSLEDMNRIANGDEDESTQDSSL